MNDWEIRNLNNQLERLDKKLHNLNMDILKENTKKFIWLIILSNFLFWLFIAYIDLRSDLNTEQLNNNQHGLIAKEIQHKKIDT